MPLLDLMTLPVRLTAAAARTTLALGELLAPDGPIRGEAGYAERLMVLIGEGGLADRTSWMLKDPYGPMTVVGTLAAALQDDRPLGRAMAPGGTVDRLLAPDGPVDRLFAEGGTLDTLLAEDGPIERLLREEGALQQLVAPDGPLERLLVAGGALDRITRPGGVLDRVLAEDGLLDRLLTQNGFVDKLIADGGTLDQLVALGRTLETIQPRLADLTAVIPELQASVEALNRAVEPLSGLANRVPRARTKEAAAAQPEGKRVEPPRRRPAKKA